MIVFDLKCENEHVFEVWFRSSADFESQREAGVVRCPECASRHVEKALMAPNVGAKSNRMKAPASAHLPPEAVAAMGDVAAKIDDAVESLRQHVEKHCDFVGDNFAEEARAMHYGEKPMRGIYGETTADEREDLAEEGIEVISLPMPSRSRKTDN